jgi:hypothetical protein
MPAILTVGALFRGQQWGVVCLGMLLEGLTPTMVVVVCEVRMLLSLMSFGWCRGEWRDQAWRRAGLDGGCVMSREHERSWISPSLCFRLGFLTLIPWTSRISVRSPSIPSRFHMQHGFASKFPSFGGCEIFCSCLGFVRGDSTAHQLNRRSDCTGDGHPNPIHNYYWSWS